MSVALPDIYLVRHGETEWSVSGRHTGRTDLPLTPEGQYNAKRLGERLREVSVAAVFTSPLQRARMTCQLAGFGERATVDPDLAEWDYGDYEGRTTADVRRERPDWNLYRGGCPHGESAGDVGVRVDQVIARVRAITGDVLIFGHRHCLSVLAARWVNLPPVEARMFWLRTASLSILGYDRSLTEPVIRLWNDDSRLRVASSSK